MAELMKTKYYNIDSLNELALRIKHEYPPFQANEFVATIMDSSWNSLELKARMRQVTLNLKKYLQVDYLHCLEILDKVILNYPVELIDLSLLFLPDFVEVYGMDESHWDISMAALERYTKYSSSEFAVRPFIINHEKRMMTQMLAWSKHPNDHVRRLASEGCRPALPWGQALSRFKEDPSLVLQILEQLKTDPSLYVRKSVANNLNDISKTHPQLITAIAKNWYGQHPSTDWIIKHGCRTLLKQGNREVLSIFGFIEDDCIKINDFLLDPLSLTINETISFSFSIETSRTTKIRLEYGIDFVKANGSRSRKIFQISETTLKENTKKLYLKYYAFEDLTTRKHYPGLHSITLIVNGIERGTLDFNVLPLPVISKSVYNQKKPIIT